jgi:hypothetical protein
VSIWLSLTGSDPEEDVCVRMQGPATTIGGMARIVPLVNPQDSHAYSDCPVNVLTLTAPVAERVAISTPGVLPFHICATGQQYWELTFADSRWSSSGWTKDPDSIV